MIKPDDSYLPADRLIAVRKEAERALNAADAFGVFQHLLIKSWRQRKLSSRPMMLSMMA